LESFLPSPTVLRFEDVAFISLIPFLKLPFRLAFKGLGILIYCYGAPPYGDFIDIDIVLLAPPLPPDRTDASLNGKAFYLIFREFCDIIIVLNS
jgi:hypothetical protein